MPRNILDLQQKGLLQLKTNSPKSTEEHKNIQFTAVNARKRQDQVDRKLKMKLAMNKHNSNWTVTV